MQKESIKNNHAIIGGNKMVETNKKEEETKKEEKHNKGIYTYMVLGLVFLLLLFSVVQAVQINNLKNGYKTTVDNGGVAVKSPLQQPSSNPQNTPTMVGGC